MQVTQGEVIAVRPEGGFRIRHESGAEEDILANLEQTQDLVLGEVVNVYGGRGGGPQFLCSSVSRPEPKRPTAPPPRPWWRFWSR